MEVRHGVVGFFRTGGDGGGVKLLFLLLSVALVLACVAGCSADPSLSSIKVAGVARFVFLLLRVRAGHLFLCCFVFAASDGFSVTDDGDGMRSPFPTGDLLVAGADLFLLSFALPGWLCAFIGFKVPRTFRGAGFCSSCQAFGVLQCSGRRIFSGHRFSCWWWRMVLSLFFFVDGMVDVLSVASVRRGSATVTALATYPRLWGSMARRTVDLDGF